ncbi:MAG TPA: BON domain-containing protein [Nitrospiraceae bacterium]|nr:BON domain-containing protein [Nitrospiraceae bacterium]
MMHRTIIVGILGMSFMILTACQSMTGKTAGQTIDDATVTTSVLAKLTSDKASNFSRIDVDTNRSVVTLNGVVRTVDEKSRAEDLARQVAGVTKVNNNLQIQSLADTGTSAPDKQMNDEMEGAQAQHVEAIKGEVLRIEGDTYVVKGEDGKEVRFHIDGTTHKTGDINQGDRIEAQLNDQNYALSIRSTPTTDRRNEKSESMLAQ